MGRAIGAGRGCLVPGGLHRISSISGMSSALGLILIATQR